MSPCLCHESRSVPLVLFYTMTPCLYHESLSNPCFNCYTMRNTVFRYTEIKITKNKEIQISELQKYNLQINRNTNYSNTDIQNTGSQKYRWLELWVTFGLCVTFALWMTFPSLDRQTDRQTDIVTDIATDRLNWSDWLIQWKISTASFKNASMGEPISPPLPACLLYGLLDYFAGGRGDFPGGDRCSPSALSQTLGQKNSSKWVIAAPFAVLDALKCI